MRTASRTALRLSLTTALPLAACDPGDVVLLAPEDTTGAPTLSIRAVIDTPYAALATSLGWSGGVPGAEVRVHLMAEPYDSTYWHVAAADSTGVATFSGLGGLYEVEVSRPLTAAEQARLGEAVHLLAGGRRLYAPTSPTADVTMGPDHRGSLVLAEYDFNIPDPLATGGREYPDAKYFEIYNNSDTTIYLDGKYWGIAWDLLRDFPYWPCTQTEVVRNDPNGVWAQRIFRFPGRGDDYPLAPGQMALVARSAIDHRLVAPSLPDLRQADFEWSSSTADNPNVPNLQDIGLRPMPPDWPWPTQPQFLSDTVDLTTLPRYVDPYSGDVWVRIPKPLVLDATASAADETTYPPAGPGSAWCAQALDQQFERLPGPAEAFGDTDDGLSMRRRVLTVLPDGRKLLQDANTSMFDFVKAPRTPGWIPDP